MISKTYNNGRLLLKYGREREIGMLDSIKHLAPEAPVSFHRISRRKKQIENYVNTLQDELCRDYEILCRDFGLEPETPLLSEHEKELNKLVPTPIPGIMGTSSYHGGYYEKVLGKEKLSSFNLNPSFAYGVLGYTEAHNFIDGKKSILQIYQATQAELWSEGYPATHDITLTEVENYMRMLEAAKVITIEKRD